MTDSKAFELGVNIATTPGKIVFQNDLMQLIQYEPSTKKQWQRPLLIVPPWINKYYILDLREKNSFVRWATGEGLTVFVISWVNPDQKLAHKDFEDYLRDGALAALDAIEKATGEKTVNAIGYCLGGTLLAATLGYMAAHKDKRIASATFMAALIDFTAAGELEVFIDEDQVASLEKKMASAAISRARDGEHVQHAARERPDLDVRHQQLSARRDPFRSTCCTGTAIRRGCREDAQLLSAQHVHENLLRKPGGLTLDGVKIDLSKVRCRRTSFRRSRTTSRRGRRRTPDPHLSAASRASCCRAPDTSPA
jgi:polyhydroxyalkanoate synthase